jgi:hypothetical protein
MVSAVNEQLLDERLAALEEARAWSPRLISKLESHIRTADDLALFRINAFSFAQERHLAENEIIDVFLHATALGLFAMDWSLYCPQCCAAARGCGRDFCFGGCLFSCRRARAAQLPRSRIKRLQAKGRSVGPARVPHHQGPGGFVSSAQLQTPVVIGVPRAIAHQAGTTV